MSQELRRTDVCLLLLATVAVLPVRKQLLLPCLRDAAQTLDLLPFPRSSTRLLGENALWLQVGMAAVTQTACKL
jgi:hypothetical protein